jgi:hypothetical protein
VIYFGLPDRALRDGSDKVELVGLTSGDPSKAFVTLATHPSKNRKVRHLCGTNLISVDEYERAFFWNEDCDIELRDSSNENIRVCFFFLMQFPRLILFSSRDTTFEDILWCRTDTYSSVESESSFYTFYPRNIFGKVNIPYTRSPSTNGNGR